MEGKADSTLALEDDELRAELANRVHLGLEQSSDGVALLQGGLVYQRFTGTGVGEVHAELTERHAQGLDGSGASLRSAVRSPSGVKEQLPAQLVVGISEETPVDIEEQDGDAGLANVEHRGPQTALSDVSRAFEPLHADDLRNLEDRADGALPPTVQQYQESQHPETEDGAAGFERKGSASSNASSQEAIQVSAMGAFMAPRVREVPVMGSECMRSSEAGDLGMQWIRQGLRGQGFQPSLQSAKVPPLRLGQVSHDSMSSAVNRVVTFHDLFAFAGPRSKSPLPESRGTSRGLLSRGKTMSQTPTSKKRVVMTPRAQTARELEGCYGRGINSHGLTIGDVQHDIMTLASAHKPDWDYAHLDPDHLYEYSQNTRYSPAYYRVRTPSIVQMQSRGSVTSRDSMRSNRMISTPRESGRASASRSPRGKLRPLVDHISRRLFGHQNPYGDEKSSTSARTSFVDAQQVGSASSGLFSVIQPRQRQAIVTPRSALLRETGDISTTFLTRKLVCAPSIDLRVRLKVSDGMRREQYKQQWSCLERQTRCLWEPKAPPHAIEEVTATNPKARQKLAMIRRFCEISAPGDDEQLASLYYRFMSHSELQDEGQQVQGFLNLLVETGALKMFENKSGFQTQDRTNDESVIVEDGILSRVEVFDVFKDMSQTFDQDQRPFTFETVKGFMEKITAKVLGKLRLQLIALKSDALNPVSIRCSQAATNGTTASLITGDAAKEMMKHGRHAGREAQNQRQGGGALRNINSDPHSVLDVRARALAGAVSGGHLRKLSPRVGPSYHVLEARKLHAATTSTLCENVPIRLYQG